MFVWLRAHTWIAANLDLCERGFHKIRLALKLHGNINPEIKERMIVNPVCRHNIDKHFQNEISVTYLKQIIHCL